MGHFVNKPFLLCLIDLIEQAYDAKGTEQGALGAENFMKLVIPYDAVTPQRQSQFTPKMKANAEPRLLSSLV